MTNREALAGRSSQYAVSWALSLAALAAPVAVSAQTTAPPAQPATASGPQSSQLTEVIVTARKRSENAQNVPASVSAFSGVQLQQDNVVSAADLVKIAPGVTLNASGRGTDTVQFIIRGIGPADSLLTTDPAVATYVDEVYQPRDYGLKLAMFDTDRTEILKGPQGTLYGRNAEGGAVGIFTREPSLSAPSGVFPSSTISWPPALPFRSAIPTATPGAPEAGIPEVIPISACEIRSCTSRTTG
jgi:iron complex outermembrane receptor protein